MCNRQGHTSRVCPDRGNYAYMTESNTSNIPSPSVPTSWCVDSRATHHMVSSPSQPLLVKPYTGRTLLTGSSSGDLYHIQADPTISGKLVFYVFFINRLPTAQLGQVSPYEKLFQRPPDYRFLKSFGCTCFPHLVPYNKHKLSSKSIKCIFLGYDNHYKGYKCFEPISRRVYISRNVTFDESDFSYTNILSKSSNDHKSVPLAPTLLEPPHVPLPSGPPTTPPHSNLVTDSQLSPPATLLPLSTMSSSPSDQHLHQYASTSPWVPQPS
ncbi:hypothetical protein L3X38_003006 [Prunus dulcis]|uniref:Retroviral polymerase SH3-like domain-containing protein n=1 Tax=Prunus dulcis TaxID=3755 RepID=A0AAD4WV44_PRUDU|nr:hypothetical protein L3X38_003006 [Prunus dulcis]